MEESSKEIASFVFFDLEATGLAETGEKPRITELSLVAVHRSSLRELCNKHTPRVLNKLTICVDPEKPISFQACSLTGLYNDVLSLLPPFNENVADLLEVFFRQLPQPICLLAHYGTKYDFPLLVAELKRVGRQMPEGVLCADTLDGFRDILSTDQVKEYIARTLSPPKAPNMRRKPGPSDAVNNAAPKGQGRGSKAVRRSPAAPTDITPEMHSVKFSSFSNAPKKNPVVQELPKEERVTTARRRLNFGSPSPVHGLSAVDDIDVEDVLDSLAGGFRVTPSNSIGFNSCSQETDDGLDSQSTIPYCASAYQNDGSGVSTAQDADDDVPDDLLLTAVEELEKSAELSSQERDEAVPSTSMSSPKTWAQVLKGQSGSSDAHAVDMVTDKDRVLAQCSTTPEPTAAPKTPTNTANAETDMNTTPTTGHKQFLDSFPTPSPSPHKSREEEDDAWPMLTSPSTSACPSPNPGTSSGGSGGGKKSSKHVGFSLALPSIHRHVIGHDPANSHSAEDDCMSLLRIAQRLSPWFCSWVDTHASEFSAVTPLYTSCKRPKKD